MRRGRKPKMIEPGDAPNQAQRLRIARDMTIADVAKAINVSEQSVSEYELQGTGIGKLKQYDLADALGVDFPTLLTPGKNFIDNIRSGLDNIR